MKHKTKVNCSWYNFETIFPTVAESLHDFLQERNIQHEISAAGDFYHFEIVLDETEKQIVEEYLLM